MRIGSPGCGTVNARFKLCGPRACTPKPSRGVLTRSQRADIGHAQPQYYTAAQLCARSRAKVRIRAPQRMKIAQRGTSSFGRQSDHSGRYLNSVPSSGVCDLPSTHCTQDALNGSFATVRVYRPRAHWRNSSSGRTHVGTSSSRDPITSNETRRRLQQVRSRLKEGLTVAGEIIFKWEAHYVKSLC
jgi:hypothetical protein